MAGSTQQRRNEVLRAIVSDFITSHEPVGSKVLVDRHKLGVSSATIRNDMAALEAEGYITQQHTSSGRIPTAKGYRRFVDGIDEIKPLSSAERRAILDFLDGGVDLEDVLRRSVQLLAQLTRQVAVVQLPDLNKARVKHCEVVALGPRRVLLVLITDTGRVEQRNVQVSHPLCDDEVATLRDLINSVMAGLTLEDACAEITVLAQQAQGKVLDPGLRDSVLAISTVLVETLLERPDDKLILAGTPHLVQTRELMPVLEALEEQVVVLRLLSSVRDLQVQVRIGEENEAEGLRSASVVSVGYGNNNEVFGGLGVVGPTHLDYPGTIASVAAVAHYVSRILSDD